MPPRIFGLNGESNTRNTRFNHLWLLQFMQFSLFCFFVFSIFLFFGNDPILSWERENNGERVRQKKEMLTWTAAFRNGKLHYSRLATDTNTEMYILNDDILWWPFIWSILSRPITNSKYVDCVVKGQGHEIYDRIFFLQNTSSLSLMNRLKQFHTFFIFAYIFTCKIWILRVRGEPEFYPLG